MIEKRESHGEDSCPLSLVKEKFYAVGVFDGLGGSGAAICKSEFGDDHTKAYVASRIIREAISNYMENAKDERGINSDGIRSTARERLEQEKSSYPTKASGLRSKLVRDYPTTLAITTALKEEEGTHIVNSYWAGDSRNYLWTQEGFFQISKDDLDTELDPLENLRNDGALSNCICADREFVINNRTISVEEKFVILSATDGCFNYFATPMHFNEVLLTGLKLSDSVEEWESFCKTKITEVTGDDVSLSLLAIGFESFKELKEAFSNSSVIKIEEIKKTQEEIKSLSKKIEERKTALENLIQEGWDEYKTSYMKYFYQVDIPEENSEKCDDGVIEEFPTPNPNEDLQKKSAEVLIREDKTVSSTETEKVLGEETNDCGTNSEKKDRADVPSIAPEESKEREASKEEEVNSIEETDSSIKKKSEENLHDEKKNSEKDDKFKPSPIDSTVNETPKFGRIPAKSQSSTLRMGSTKPSGKNVFSKCIHAFIKHRK